MRSASAIAVCVAAAACALVAVAVSGCDTTQDAAARIKVRSERTLASRKPTKVRKQAKDVKVKRATLLESNDGTALAVTLRNLGSEPVNDLPLLVGVRTAAGDKQYLNDGKDVPYFKTHSPAIAAGESAIWVYTNKHEVPGAAAAFAEIGAPPTPPVTTASSVPQVDVADPEPAPGDPGKVRVNVSNDIGFVQYELEVFAWAMRGDRLVAAGAASAGDLEPGETEPVTVKLIGDPKGAQLHVSAPPTIYQ